MLQAPAVAGSEHTRPETNGKGKRLEDRPTWENHVVRMAESANTILIAARTTLFESLDLFYEVNFKEQPDAQTKIRICKATIRQPICNLGKVIIVCGIHGNNKTMKREYPTAFI